MWPIPVDDEAARAAAGPDALELELQPLPGGATWDRSTVQAYSATMQDAGCSDAAIQEGLNFYAGVLAATAARDAATVQRLTHTWRRTAALRGIPGPQAAAMEQWYRKTYG